MELKNSQISSLETRFAWWVVFFAVVFHLAALWLPFVNLEWAFVDAAKYFETGNNSLLERYFTVQANTLGTSLLAYAIHSILPFLPLEILPRLLSIAGFIFPYAH